MTDLSTYSREDIKIVDDDLSVILADTIADYESRTGKVLQPAHVERLLINTFAYRETLSKQQLNEAYRQQHVRFATGLMLDICGDDVNTPRLEAQPALTTIRFSVSNTNAQTQIPVPVGTRVAVGELIYATKESGILSANKKSIDLIAACTTNGTAGNGWRIGQISTLVDGLNTTLEVKVSNITVPSAGTNIETDDAYRTRIFLAMESFSVAGPIGAYEYFTRQVSSAICDVTVDNPLGTDGKPIGGRVEVTILTKDGVPSHELITEVQTALSAENKRPLCDVPIVQAPTVVNYSVTAALTLYVGSNAADVLAAARAAWEAYDAQTKLELGTDVVPLNIQKVLQVAGVYNVALTGLNVIEVAPNEWAKCTIFNLSIAGTVNG